MEPADEEAFGDHLDARCGRDRAVEPGAEAGGLAYLFAEQARHAGCCGACGEAARFQHHDAAAIEPARTKQGERDERGLACTWGSYEDSVRSPLQGVEKGGKSFVDREIREHRSCRRRH